MDRKVEGSKPGGSRRAQPDGATLSCQSAELADSDGVQGTKRRSDGFGRRWNGLAVVTERSVVGFQQDHDASETVPLS